MKELPLHEWHTKRGAKMGEFAGFSMPLYYTKPLEEHRAVRQKAGVFDISHMGQFTAEGAGTEDFLHYALTNDVKGMTDGRALYSPICREDGGVLDDLIVYRGDSARFRIIVNAATREKDFRWLQGLAEPYDVKLRDISEDWCLFAVQGPGAFDELAPFVSPAPHHLEYYSFCEATAFGQTVFLARTGYTGEPGCELAMPREQAARMWRILADVHHVAPIGLAARDTLRLEAGMALYGNELREEWNPLESGLGWAVKLGKEGDFMGRAALEAAKAAGVAHRSVGIELTSRGIARSDYPVLSDGKAVGAVTSGVLSPTTGKAIALARVESRLAAVGTPLQVEIRGRSVGAVVVRKPFYQNPKVKD